MHEVAVARALIDIATRCATEAGLRRVCRMNIELAAGAAIPPASLAFAIGVMAHGGPAEGAEVTFSGPGAIDEVDDANQEHDHFQEQPVDPANAGIRLTWIDGD